MLINLYRRLFPTRAMKFDRVAASVHPSLMRCAQAMQVKVFGLSDTDDLPSVWTDYPRAMGIYIPMWDRIGIHAPTFVDRLDEVNTTLAHELMHSTGHPKRFGRTNSKTFFSPDPATVGREEIIAQYGAMLLMRKLGVEMCNVEAETEAYLKKWGRPDGLPSHSEAVEAIRAVKYVLQCLEKFNGGQNHAQSSATDQAA